VLAPELAGDDMFRVRFLEESRIAASLNHPNVIPIYDAGSSDGLLYIAMRYVSGTDLRQMIKKRGRLIPYVALSLTGQAARALDAAIIWAHVEESPTMATALQLDLPPAVDGVFARVLAKEPGDRYANCREFIEAMRVALGSLAADPRTLGSLDIVGAAPAGGNQASIPTEPFHPLEVSHELPGGTVAAGAQAVPAQRGDTVASHRRQPGAAPPGQAGGPDGLPPAPGRTGPRRRWFARPGWIAALTAVVLLAAGAGTWALVSGRPGSHVHDLAASSASAKPKPPSALMSAIILANQSGGAKGLLPPSTCKQQSATMVTCTAPAPGITQVTFRTYPSLTALYDAYTAQVKSLNSGSFQPNFQDCGIEQTYGEVSWNHQFQHPKTYSVTQSSSGTLTDDQAAGRVFCNLANGQESFVWTQNNGHLLAVVAGPVHEDVWNWWLNIHHNIGFAGAPMNM
jgi:hypothetical protein